MINFLLSGDEHQSIINCYELLTVIVFIPLKVIPYSRKAVHPFER